jgi:hypothetical protein
VVVVVVVVVAGGVVVVGCAFDVLAAWVNADVAAVVGVATWMTAMSETGFGVGAADIRLAMDAPPASTAPASTATRLARRDALPRRDPYTDGDRITLMGVSEWVTDDAQRDQER